MAPPNIAGYTIDRTLGRGGFASVYLAHRDGDGQPVAIKVLYDHVAGTDALVRFDRERRSMSALSEHPNIVDVLDAGTTADDHYLVLEYAAGGSLKDRLARDGAMPWPEVVDVGIQICGALDAAHRIGVLHRDVKPANIFMDTSGAKLGDFGIARLIGSSDVTAAESIIGTLAYTPPETLRNSAFDGRGDIYQLGITLYELLLGRAPFRSGAADSKAVVIRRILEDPAPPLAQFDVPQPLSDLLAEVLAKDPADRPQTAAEFGRRLSDVGARLGMRRPADPLPVRAGDSTVTIATLDRTPVEPSPLPPLSSTIQSEFPAAGPPVTGAGPGAPAPRRYRRGLLAGLVVIIGAVVAGALVTSGLRGDERPPGAEAPEVDPPELPETPTLVRIEQPAFASPDGTDGVIFDAVANSAGLTAVGGAGDGEGVGDQEGIVWTMAPDGSWAHQRGFAPTAGADRQRLRGIGVIDGVRLVAVGEDGGGSTLDGTAWIGLTVARMQRLTDASFSGPGRQTLQAVAGDPGREQFIIAGERTGPDGPSPGLWVLEAGSDWFEPQWTQVEIPSDRAGALLDVAVAGDIAVAVGYEDTDSGRQTLTLIRREDDWVHLLAPIAGAELVGVDVVGDRIVAVGNRRAGESTEPIAFVASVQGTGALHRLRTGSVAGRVHDVVATRAGVFAAGLVAEDEGSDAVAAGRTDGALWTLVTGESPEGDRWQRRDVAEFRVDGFEEVWSVVEYEGAVFALGRGTDGDRRPAAGWTVTVEPVTDDPEVADEVTEAQGEIGVAPGGCAEQAESDVGQSLAPVLITATADYALWICQDADGALWYHGAELRNESIFITLPASAVAGGYEAQNTGGTTYRIVDGRLTVRTPSGSLDTDQPLIDN